VAAYSIHSQLATISLGPPLHPPREDAPRYGDKQPNYHGVCSIIKLKSV